MVVVEGRGVGMSVVFVSFEVCLVGIIFDCVCCMIMVNLLVLLIIVLIVIFVGMVIFGEVVYGCIL